MKYKIFAGTCLLILGIFWVTLHATSWAVTMGVGHLEDQD